MKRPSLLVIFLTVFIDLVGFGIVLPLLPRYGEEYGASGFMIGLVIASFSIMQFFVAPWWGRWSDRVGRRPVLLISNAGSAVSYAMFAWSAWPGLAPATALTVLLLSRVFAGVCGANISVASAYIADITPPEGRSKGMGLIGVAFGLGFILGPALGALSAQRFGLTGPGWVAATLCTANCLVACVVLQESRKPGSKPGVGRPKWAQWAHTLRMPKVGLLVGLYGLATFCFACFESTLPLLLGSPGFHPDEFVRPRELAQRLVAGVDPVARHLRPKLSGEFQRAVEGAPGEAALRRSLYVEVNRLLRADGFYLAEAWQGIELRPETRRALEQPRRGESSMRRHRLLLEDAFPAELRRETLYFDERRLGYLFAYCGLVSALVQGGVIGRLVKRFGEPKLIWGSLAVVAAGMALLPYAERLGWLLVALALLSAGSGVNRAPTLGLISIHTPPEEQGASLGVAQSAGTLARMTGPIVAASLYQHEPHSPFWMGAVLALGAAWLAWRGLAARRPAPRQDVAVK